jgi:membrane peptidoglycan carboxypeptidase
VEQEGYATNGKENIAIRPLSIDKVTTKSGKETKVFGGKLLSGYELQWDGGVVAIIDLMDNNIWLYNDMEPSEKLVLSSVASAILLKRMQDVQKDKDAFDN